jgi:hypothetical protein
METERVYCAVRAKYLSQLIVSQLHFKDGPAISMDQGGRPRTGKQTKIWPRAPRSTKEYDRLTDGPSAVTSLWLIPLKFEQSPYVSLFRKIIHVQRFCDVKFALNAAKYRVPGARTHVHILCTVTCLANTMPGTDNTLSTLKLRFLLPLAASLMSDISQVNDYR